MPGRIILASASPRRKELLTQIGINFTAMVSDKETEPFSNDPVEVCREEARMKAEDVAEKAKEIFPGLPFIVVGADTVVSCDGLILGKPADKEDAASMLRRLSGKTHQVYTGVCAIACGGAVLADGSDKCLFVEGTDVKVTELTEEDIEDYLSTKEPYDKAGAYGIQGIFARYVEGVDGDYNNVVGLPVGRLYRTCLSGVVD